MRTKANLGSKIRKWRSESGLTLRKAAEMAGISPPYLSDIELNRRTFSAMTLVNLAKALGVTSREMTDALIEQNVDNLQEKMQELKKGVR